MRTKLILFGLLGYFCSGIQSTTIDEVFDEEFQLFQIQYGKKYISRSEHDYRKQNFLENSLMIALHNQKFHQGESTFSMGINQFADQSTSEIEDMFSTATFTQSTDFKTIPVIKDPKPPNKFDWRSKGWVTDVKDQGKCKAAWTFAAAAAFEGSYFNKTKKLVDFSEQQLIDCPDLDGCNVNYAIDMYRFGFCYVQNNGGIELNADYPFVGKKGQCSEDQSKKIECIGYYTMSVAGDEELLETLVAFYGPSAVAVDGRLNTFVFYKQGVYNDKDCRNQTGRETYALLAVGYDKDSSAGDYWILKNSWGITWGEEGYIRLARNKNNQCGIANVGFVPIF
ncbi:hypothetical protein CHUAL_008869 [Chamberlinius hualienensis]